MNELALVIALSEQQHGLVSRRQLYELGFSRQAVARVFASSNWIRESRNVLRRAGSPASNGQRLVAAVLDVGHDAVISHMTAARWWGLTGCSLTPITVITTSESKRVTPLAVVRRVRLVPHRWVTVLWGVPIVRPELLALHLFADSSEGRAERLVDRLWSMRLLSGRSIEAMLADIGESGRNGIAGLRRYLEPRGADYVPPATGLEGRVMRMLAEAGIPMRRQVDSGGEQWTGRVDFRHEHLPLIVEVQSEAYHAALVDVRSDKARITALREDGFEVVEVTNEDVFQRPAYVVQTVATAAARLRAAL